MHCKIPIPQKNEIRITSKTKTDITFSSPLNPSPVITHNIKLQIRKWSRNTGLITADSIRHR